MKKLSTLILLSLFLFAGCGTKEKKPKYVFYFIGDGLSLCQINATEAYLAAKRGVVGNDNLCFTDFPYTGYATSFCADRYVTDSAAAGTALATGSKTSYGTLGMDSARNQPLISVAEKAKRAGKRSGVLTSVSVDHATPGAFYGHQPDRNNYYEIAMDGITAGLDFYGGGGYLGMHSKTDPGAKDVLTVYTENGYAVVKGLEQFNQLSDTVSRVVMIQTDGNGSDLPYAIDRKEGDMKLSDLVRAAIKVLDKGDKGFFMMVEGGKIDWADHSNDGACSIQETLDFDEAIQVAYEFYKQHPDETLIVVTQDHETGGMTLCAQPNLPLLDHQSGSLPILEAKYAQAHADNARFGWADAQKFLAQHFGFGGAVTLSENDEKALRQAFDNERKNVSAAREKAEFSYADIKYQVVAEAVKILNYKAGLRWTTIGHSGIPVMIHAIGSGADHFVGKMDNTDIPKRIEALMLN